MCEGWLQESGIKKQDDVNVPTSWIDNYINRRCPEKTSSDTKERLRKAVHTCVTCTLILLGKDTYSNPEKSLCELRDSNDCIRRVERSLSKIQNLTPAYDCISVLGMLSHIMGPSGQKLCFSTTQDERSKNVHIVRGVWSG
mgnify:CR=1 FL=1